MLLHPAFHNLTVKNDLAVLRVDGDFDIADNVVPICLPDQEGAYTEYDKAGCVATGWGKDQWGEKEKKQEFCNILIISFSFLHCCRSFLFLLLLLPLLLAVCCC